MENVRDQVDDFGELDASRIAGSFASGGAIGGKLNVPVGVVV
jgi:hypothetical protein